MSPHSPPSLCTTPGCGNLTTSGPCDTCRAKRRKASDQARGTSQRRGYGHRHRNRFRPAVLQRDPICVICRARPATIADHHPQSRRQLVAAGLDPDDPQHGRGLCKTCHDRETARHQPGGWNSPDG